MTWRFFPLKCTQERVAKPEEQVITWCPDKPSVKQRSIRCLLRGSSRRPWGVAWYFVNHGDSNSTAALRKCEGLGHRVQRAVVNTRAYLVAQGMRSLGIVGAGPRTGLAQLVAGHHPASQQWSHQQGQWLEECFNSFYPGHIGTAICSGKLGRKRCKNVGRGQTSWEADGRRNVTQERKRESGLFTYSWVPSSLCLFIMGKTPVPLLPAVLK